MDIGNQMAEFNEHLMSCIINLRCHRTELQRQMELEEKQRTCLQIDIEKISYKLANINKTISHQSLLLENYDRSITELENGYKTMLSMANALLITAKQVEQNLNLEKLETPEIADITSNKMQTSSESVAVESQDCSKSTLKKTTELMEQLDELQEAEKRYSNSIGEKRMS